jgi:hypothetical protein
MVPHWAAAHVATQITRVAGRGIRIFADVRRTDAPDAGYQPADDIA